ncbi:ATP-binding protein [Marinobacter sp. SS21]|uniref:ATP-binding protein n=1 Tax=Marinobacter sp. SS21 TaxID=2979460 RepID=UPI00232D889B|nr:ATP-binding protein [Marinobacter sp. SS21]MDC0663389.1 ATP-binding protein [Marinobacter sp. SS21]
MTLRKRASRSLSRHLLWLGILPALLMFLVLMFFFTSARLDDARKDLFNSGQLLADNLAPAVEYAVVSGNTQVLQQTLEQSIRRSQVNWIRVKDVTGRTVGTVQQDDGEIDDSQGQVFIADILQLPLDMGTERSTGWFEPNYGFSSGAIRIGAVEVGVSEAVIAAKQRDILWSSFIVGLALLFFTVLVVRRSLTSLVGPMQDLADRVTALIGGDYANVPIKRLHNTTEIIELEKNLNSLARHMQNLQSSRDQTLAASETARERAESASKAKSEFLAVMSHELRTPLNGVLGMIELITEDELTEQQRDYLHTAKRSTEDLLTVISDILDFSRMDRGQLALDYHDFDIREVIENCVATFRHAAEQQGLSLSLQFSGNWPGHTLVRGDAPRLRQVLAGLLDNGIKFTEEGTISVQAEWHHLEHQCMVLQCTVRDSGSGIPSERMKEIFRTFEQLDNSDARRHGGTGIGLALVQKLVELMGGHIKVDTDLGMGSAFCFELPFELDTDSTTDESQSQSQSQSQSRVIMTDGATSRALVVEDNPVNQRVATALLTRLGFETDAVSNGQDALERVQSLQFNYSVILMDCQMPVMDGYETTRSIREWEQQNGHTSVPIIALTADVLPGTENTCREAGMNDYLAKPVRKENLRAVLSRWIRF